jgi:hypothetical protein
MLRFGRLESTLSDFVALGDSSEREAGYRTFEGSQGIVVRGKGRGAEAESRVLVQEWGDCGGDVGAVFGDEVGVGERAVMGRAR